jgi:hypothetical protein
MLRNYARKAVGSILRFIVDRKHVDEVPTNGSHVEPEPDPPKSQRPPYNPRHHPTHYHVAPILLKLLQEHGGPKTVKDFVDLSGNAFAQSTARQTCKILIEDGLLKKVDEGFPASYLIADEEGVKTFLLASALFVVAPKVETDGIQ